jgi:hypothetical protein
MENRKVPQTVPFGVAKHLRTEWVARLAPSPAFRHMHSTLTFVTANQQEDIYNISSRVQGQGQWPTHDAHVSLDNFAITNELNKYNDGTSASSSSFRVVWPEFVADPPTYEEAMSIATSINNNTVVPAVVPKTTITPTSTTATSTSN